MKIMIVDDDPGVTLAARAILEDAGHIVSVHLNALGTTARILREQPDLVLLDIEMPSLNGIQLAGIVRRRMSTTTVILYSGKSDDELEVLAAGCGAHGWLCKDTPPRKMLAYIARFAS